MHVKHLSRIAALLAVAALAGTMTAAAVASGDHPARHARGGEHGDHHSRLPKSYVLPGNALFPEGMGYDRETGNFYTGSLLDGTIVRGNVAGAAGRGSSRLQVLTDARACWACAPTAPACTSPAGATGTVWIYDKSNCLLHREGVERTAQHRHDPERPRRYTRTASSSPTRYRRPSGGSRSPTTASPPSRSGWTSRAPHSGTPGGFNADGIAATPDGGAT